METSSDGSVGQRFVTELALLSNHMRQAGAVGGNVSVMYFNKWIQTLISAIMIIIIVTIVLIIVVISPIAPEISNF
jgi:hypothetical protein